MATVRARDSCVVDSAPLSLMLRSFVDDWARERPPRSGGQFAKGEKKTRTLEPVGALQWLASETRTQSPPGVSKGMLERVAAGRSRTTELRVADAIVQALGHPEAFHDGTLEIQQNPHVSQARMSCCGGSLTGVLQP